MAKKKEPTKKKAEKYSREHDLAKKFNDYWNGVLETQENHYRKLSLLNLIELKKAVSNINNIVTFEATKRFVRQLKKHGTINSTQAKKMLETIDGQHPNANGFDVEDESSRIIAEVKCNIPVKDATFGASQKSGILKDLKGLKEGKKTSAIQDVSGFRKFMVILNGDKVKDAMGKLVENDNSIIEFRRGRIDTKHIYIVYIDI